MGVPRNLTIEFEESCLEISVFKNQSHLVMQKDHFLLNVHKQHDLPHHCQLRAMILEAACLNMKHQKFMRLKAKMPRVRRVKAVRITTYTERHDRWITIHL